MRPPLHPLVPLDGLTAAPARWVWDGYLARGTVALLTGKWKGGKTTLLAGLLRSLSLGRPFLGRACGPGSAVVVSEESRDMWAERVKAIPVGPRIDLLARPFDGRPAPDDWDDLVRSAADRPDLFVVDPLAAFLPGRESDPDALAALFRPLRWLADRGTAVLVLHHPRKAKAEEGKTARGGSGLLRLVDVTLELVAVGRPPGESRLRRLTARGPWPQTPAAVYEWTPGTAAFHPADDQVVERGWAALRLVLEGKTAPVTRRDLLDDWPPELPCPSAAQLHRWLNRAAADGRVERTGGGTKGDPYRFRLPPR